MRFEKSNDIYEEFSVYVFCHDDDTGEEAHMATIVKRDATEVPHLFTNLGCELAIHEVVEIACYMETLV